MATDELTDVRRTLRASLTELERKAARIRRALEALEFDATDRPARQRTQRKQRGGGVYEAVRQLVATLEPQETFTAESLAERLQTQGFVSSAADPVNAYRSVLSRLSRSGEIEREERGIYRATRQVEEDPAEDVPLDEASGSSTGFSDEPSL